MRGKCNLSLYVIGFVLLLVYWSPSMAITNRELSDICAKMESAIVDVSVEYELYVIPTSTLEDIRGTGLAAVKDGLRRFKLSAACLSSDVNDPNSRRIWQWLLERSEKVISERGSWDNVIKECYDGKVWKRLVLGGITDKGVPVSSAYGVIAEGPNSLPTWSALGYSVLRTSLSVPEGKRPLSMCLRDKEFVHIDETAKKVNDFNTIRADLLTHGTEFKQAYLRIYFSVDYNCTPIRYEYMAGGETPENNRVAFTVDVTALDKVGYGLWFPSSGVAHTPDEEYTWVYIATSNIVVNQGLTGKDFDIDFPPGTEVWDKIRNLKYVVRPTEEQFRQ